VNNVIYDWGRYTGFGYGLRVRDDAGETEVNANVVNNYFIAGSGATMAWPLSRPRESCGHFLTNRPSPR
jgi:hypothetical protein